MRAITVDLVLLKLQPPLVNWQADLIFVCYKNWFEVRRATKITSNLVRFSNPFAFASQAVKIRYVQGNR